MRNLLAFIISLGLLATSAIALPQRVVFLHHSTGDNVYYDGKVKEWITTYNSQHNKAYVVKERTYPNDPYPWQNNPYDYWNLWINNACNNADPDIECLSSICTNYNVIIYKHCYPAAGIQADDPEPSVSSSGKTLTNYKLQYRALRDLMDGLPDNKFIIWTLTPLHRLSTDPAKAARAREFVNWVKNEWLTEDGKEHTNINIFDFYGLVAELNDSPGSGQVNCLKYEFEKSHDDANSHPNLAANEYVGPIFAQFIVNTLENNIIPSALPADLITKPTVMILGDVLRIQQGSDGVYENVTVYNLQGKPLFTKSLRADCNEFDISNLVPGLYLVRMMGTGGNMEVAKVWKK